MAERMIYHSPSISVIVATYNRPKSIERLLINLSDQRCVDFAKIDVAVVDDGSVNKPLFEPRYPFTFYYIPRDRAEDNMPRVYSSRNIGAKNTHGEFILQLDDDLEFSPYMLNLLQTASGMTNSDDFVWTARISNNKDIYITPDVERRADYSRGKDGRWFDGKTEWTKFDWGGTSSAGMFMPRHTWNKIGGYNEIFDGAMGESDQEVSLRVQKIGGSVYIAPYFVNVSDEETGSYRMDMIAKRKRTKTNAEIFKELHPDCDEWRMGGAKYV